SSDLQQALGEVDMQLLEGLSSGFHEDADSVDHDVGSAQDFAPALRVRRGREIHGNGGHVRTALPDPSRVADAGDHIAAFCQQKLKQPVTDKAGGAGENYAHGASP